MNRVLGVSVPEKMRAFFEQHAASFRFSWAADGAGARGMLAEESFDVLVINAPLPDETGERLAQEQAAASSMGILLAAPEHAAAETERRLEGSGVFVLSKPINRARFEEALRFAGETKARLDGIGRENLRLQRELRDIRLINRAKCTLIQYLNMTEPQAHYYIEKQAMDMRMSREEIAREILKTYES